MSDYQAMGILNQLLTKGTVTQEEVDEIADQIIDKEMEDAVVLFHLLFCPRKHHSEGCLFEQEVIEIEIDTWKAPIHIKWVKYTKKIMYELKMNAQTFKETLNEIRSTFRVLEEVREEKGNWMKLIDLYIQMRFPMVRLPMLLITSNPENVLPFE